MSDEWLAWLSRLPPGARDTAAERWLGIADPATHASPGENLIGYQPSGVAPIVRALVEVPVLPTDVLVDLGAGLGKVVLLARWLTGVTARGIELQPALVERARACASKLGIDATFVHADAREATIDDGTVFFLYTPCTGSVLGEIFERLHGVARHHAIVVCALGFDVDRRLDWLAPRPTDAFWLTIYDSVVSGVAPRPEGPSPLRGPAVDAIAFDRPLSA
jgi:hypothetical protein